MYNRAFYIGGRRSALTDLGLKTAAAASEEKPDENLGLKAYGLGVAGQLAGAAGGHIAMDAYTKADKSQHLADTQAHELGQADAPEAYSKKLIDTHAAKYKPVEVDWDPMDANGPHFRFEDHGINADLAKPSTLAHALGHVELRENMPRLGKGINFSRMTRGLSGIGSFGAGALAPGENHPGYVAGASALASVPTLADEAYASAKALKNLRNVGYKGNALRVLGPAFGTYLANTAMNVGGDVASYELGRGARNLYGIATGNE